MTGQSVNTCGTCVHFGPPVSADDGESPTGYHRCKLIDLVRKKQTPDALAYTQDGSDYVATLCVREEFGCIEHKAAPRYAIGDQVRVTWANVRKDVATIKALPITNGRLYVIGWPDGGELCVAVEDLVSEPSSRPQENGNCPVCGGALTAWVHGEVGPFDGPTVPAMRRKCRGCGFAEVQGQP